MQEQSGAFFIPKENPTLNQEQVSRFTNLEKVEYVNGNFQHSIGEVNLLARPDSAPKTITSPNALLKFIRETARENGISPWEVAEQIRTAGVEDPEKLATLQRRYKETIAYVGDLHGGDEDLFKRLSEMTDKPPAYLIFEGDMMGTKNFEDLQRLFYNYLNNHSRNELLRQDPEATDEAILTYSGTKPPEDGFNLKKGFLKIRTFELQLEGKSDEEIQKVLDSMPDHEIAEEIRRYAKFVHYGHYASNLPENARKNLASGLESNAQRLVNILTPIMKKGTRVFMLEGNWDARAPIDFKSGEPTAIPLPPEQRLFNVGKFFKEKGVNFLTNAQTLETKTSLHVLFPFDSLVGFPNLSKEEKDKIRQAVEAAKKENKTIIVVAHGEPNWQIHNITVKDARPGGEHAQVIQGLEEALGMILPDEIIYGHMHDPLIDEQKNKQDVNTKYALRIRDGKTELVDDPSKIDQSSIVASYIQLRRIAQASVPIDNARRISGFGGRRQPARVK